MPKLAALNQEANQMALGIKWGQSASTAEGLILVESDGDTDCYIKENDELKMGAAKLEAVFYLFWQDKATSAMLFTKGISNYKNLKAVMFEKFGEGYQHNEYIEEYTWFGDITTMILNYNEFSKKGVLCMFSVEVGLQEEEWEKEQAKKGAEEGW